MFIIYTCILLLSLPVTLSAAPGSIPIKLVADAMSCNSPASGGGRASWTQPAPEASMNPKDVDSKTASCYVQNVGFQYGGTLALELFILATATAFINRRLQ